MSTNLSPADEMLYRVADEVLHYIWDPIGVSAVPQARDEYHGYLPHVFNLLRNGTDEITIAKYLGEVITNRMGLSTNNRHDLEVARILTGWKKAVDERFA